MERIYTLIDKLYQQKAQSASPAHLLFTVQLLQQELTQVQKQNGSPGYKRVCVTLPVNFNFSEEALRAPFSESGKEKEIFVLDVIEEEPVVEEVNTETEVVSVPVFEAKEYVLQKPVLQGSLYNEPVPEVREEAAPAYSSYQAYNSAFDTVTEAPTLTQYAVRKEVHHAISNVQESLNDRLKEDKTEVAHRLKETPIKDLRKAIGINDRFVFVKELFRGDEAGYERSIKTINGFNIYSEAEYWMARELRLKLAWSDDNETVKHFYSLVRRRFS
ncbi:MAG: hypothetical protein JWR72_4183 [Flavisolibacter sp.]|jgi:hypothetical protein|nr:hypothetical protein [Flavisolibacter sp.]